MSFGEIILIWRRRPVLTAALILIALFGGGAAAAWLPGTYQAQATMVLLASKSAAKLTGGNPYLSFTPSLSLAADVVSRAMMSPQTAELLAGRGFSGSYTVAPPQYSTTTTGSVLVITVTGHGKADVESTLHAVIGQVRSSLSRIQAGLPARARISAVTLAASPAATLAVSTTMRPVLMTVIAGMALALAFPVLVDGLAARRRRGSHSHSYAGSSGADSSGAEEYAREWSRIG